MGHGHSCALEAEAPSRRREALDGVTRSRWRRGLALEADGLADAMRGRLVFPVYLASFLGPAI